MNVAIIPGYNPGKRLEKVIGETVNYVDSVVFIDDGCTDDSLQIAKKYNIKILSHAKNLGKGFALKTGTDFALKQLKADKIVYIDADGQHDPKDIPRFLKELGGADIVIGSRIHNKNSMPYIRRISNQISAYLISKVAQVKFIDSQTGFRAIRSPVFNKVKFIPGRYETETRFLIDVARSDLKIKFIPINSLYSDENGKIVSGYKPIKDSLRILKIIYSMRK